MSKYICMLLCCIVAEYSSPVSADFLSTPAASSVNLDISPLPAWPFPFPREKTVLLGLSGGDAPGIMTFAAHLAKKLRTVGLHLVVVHGGIEGVTRNPEEFVVPGKSLLYLNEKEWERLSNQPSAPGKSSRAKFDSESPEQTRNLLVNLSGIKALVGIGGGEHSLEWTLEGDYLDNNQEGTKTRCFIAFKTVDGDTLCRPLGFSSTVEHNRKLLKQAMLTPSNPDHWCYIMEVMGRDTGFITYETARGLAVSIVPEFSVDFKTLFKSIMRYVVEHKVINLVASEGFAIDLDDEFIKTIATVDPWVRLKINMPAKKDRRGNIIVRGSSELLLRLLEYTSKTPENFIDKGERELAEEFKNVIGNKDIARDNVNFVQRGILPNKTDKILAEKIAEAIFINLMSQDTRTNLFSVIGYNEDPAWENVTAAIKTKDEVFTQKGKDAWGRSRLIRYLDRVPTMPQEINQEHSYAVNGVINNAFFRQISRSEYMPEPPRIKARKLTRNQLLKNIASNFLYTVSTAKTHNRISIVQVNDDGAGVLQDVFKEKPDGGLDDDDEKIWEDYGDTVYVNRTQKPVAIQGIVQVIAKIAREHQTANILISDYFCLSIDDYLLEKLFKNRPEVIARIILTYGQRENINPLILNRIVSAYSAIIKYENNDALPDTLSHSFPTLERAQDVFARDVRTFVSQIRKSSDKKLYFTNASEVLCAICETFLPEDVEGFRKGIRTTQLNRCLGTSGSSLYTHNAHGSTKALLVSQ